MRFYLKSMFLKSRLYFSILSISCLLLFPVCAVQAGETNAANSADAAAAQAGESNNADAGAAQAAAKALNIDVIKRAILPQIINILS